MLCQKVFAPLMITALVSLTAFGAPPNTNKNSGGDPASRTADQRTSWRNGDHFLATCVAIANQEEVAISRWAEKKLSDKDAQEFAQMLIDDHTAFLKKLQQFAPEATQEGFLRQSSGGERAEGRRTEPRTAAQRTNEDNLAKPAGTVQRTAAKPNLNEQGNPPIDLMQLHREMAEQCLADTEEKLGEKSGKEFDECFIGMQIGMHNAMKAKLEVMQRHASGELKNILAQGLKTTTTHLDRAEKLKDQLSDSDKTASKSK